MAKRSCGLKNSRGCMGRHGGEKGRGNNVIIIYTYTYMYMCIYTHTEQCYLCVDFLTVQGKAPNQRRQNRILILGF